VVPNTSGRNAHYSFDQMLAAFAALRRHVETSSAPGTQSQRKGRRAQS
jgi:hypothetical protein